MHSCRISRSSAARDRDYVLCGDVNIAHREIDLKNWKSNRKNSGFLPEERAWLDRVFGELKWVDSFREVDPRPGAVHLVVEPRPGAREKRRVANRLPDREPLARRPGARGVHLSRQLVLRPRAAHDGLRAVKAWGAVKPYLEKESLAAFFVGVSSGFPYAMIGATLTTRLAQDGIDKRTITAFTFAFLVYNLKVFWAWIVDGVRIPLLGRLGQRVSWLLLAGAAVIAAVINLAFVDPSASIRATVIAAVLVGIAGATYDIVIDAYRIETLKPSQLGVGSGMSQYGWRIGSAAAGALALVVAEGFGWSAGYAVCAVFALPAMLTGLVVGEPARHVAIEKKGASAVWASIIGPFVEFMRRSGAWLVLLFVLVHKIGDTLSQLTVAPAVQRPRIYERRDRHSMTSDSDSGPFSSEYLSAASSTRSSD